MYKPRSKLLNVTWPFIVLLGGLAWVAMTAAYLLVQTVWLGVDAILCCETRSPKHEPTT